MKGRLVPREALRAVERDGMQKLLSAHFAGVEPGSFDRDLAEKNWVLLLEEDGRIRGFSTIFFYTTSFRGESLSVVYSGDTIVERGAWGTLALPASWIAAVRWLKQLRPSERTFWLLLTSGFRTYRFLPVFWSEFHPRFDSATPPDLAELTAHLARERLAGAFDPARGIARLAAPQRLREDLQTIPGGKTEDDHVSFFLERNPGWTRGDELVCLAEVALEKLRPAGQRLWTAGRCATPGSGAAA